MNLNHLAIFHAVAEAGNVTAGAERLHISQPAVSKQLRELERSIGMPLFDRLPRGVRLTEAGALLHEYARRLFALEAEAGTALAELRGLERGRVAVGASVTVGSYLLPAVVAAFHAAHPGVEVAVEIANTEEVQRRLLAGALDLAVTEGAPGPPELTAEVVRRDELVVIAAPGHCRLGGAGAAATLEQLAAEPFVMREAGSGTRAVIEAALMARGVGPVAVAATLGGIEAVKRAVAAGLGVAMVSTLALELELRAGTLKRVPVAGFTLERPLHLQQARARHASRAAQAFAAAVREAARRG